MARGNYWEMSYLEEDVHPLEEVTLRDLEGTTGFSDRRVVSDCGEVIKLTQKDSKKRFERCDIALDVKDSSFTNCEFVKCRFKGSTWTNVKFSNCVFEYCHFSEAIFLRCFFLDSCVFKKNSASAELLRMEETAISSSAFLQSLETNLSHLPPNKTPDYQRHRLVGTKEKIAKILYSSTRNEADVDFYYQAYKELVCCKITNKIEKLRYSSTDDGERQVGSAKFFFRSILPRLERVIIVVSGWLTDWGRSLTRAFAFFGVVVFFFAGMYLLFQIHTPWTWRFCADAALRSLNVTLVTGYTAHFNLNEPVFLQILTFLNVSLGIFWYSLLIPVLSRRTLR